MEMAVTESFDDRKEPMISVAMTTWNGERFLRQQLDSLFSQIRRPDEVIVVDDGSSDATMEILQEYAQKFPELTIHRNPHNLGYRRNFRKAVSLAAGDIIFLCDQDDIWFPEKIRDMVKILDQDPQIQVLASSFQFMNAEGNPYEVRLRKGLSNNNLYLRPVSPDAIVPVTFKEFCSHNYFQGCSMCMRRGIARQFTGQFTDRLPHDWLIALIGAHEKSFFFYNHPLFYYRMHDSNTIGILKGKKNEEWVRLQFAADVFDVMSVIEERWPEEWGANPDLKNRKQFSQEHMQALKTRNIPVLIRQNLSPYYREMKSFRARMMDLYFALTHWNEKNHEDR